MFPPRDYPLDPPHESKSCVLVADTKAGTFVNQPLPKECVVDQSIDSSEFDIESMSSSGIPLGSFIGSYTSPSPGKALNDVKRAAASIAKTFETSPSNE